MTENKTVKAYWDGIWQSEGTATNIEPEARGIKNYTTRQFHAYFKRVFSNVNTPQSRLLEIGCANSAWLPYFSKEFGFDVSGLDYSQIGCDRTKRNFVNNGVEGEVICADLFSPPEHMLGKYDVVVSFGVAEHFEDTSKCLRAMSKLLKPGGLLITNIPNMSGFLGGVQKLLNRPVFDIHNPLNAQQFERAHEIAGCEIIECYYFMSTNFGVCNLNGIPQKTIEWIIKKVTLAVLVRVSMFVWRVEEKVGGLNPRRFFSPYINCIARKPSTYNKGE